MTYLVAFLVWVATPTGLYLLDFHADSIQNVFLRRVVVLCLLIVLAPAVTTFSLFILLSAAMSGLGEGWQEVKDYMSDIRDRFTWAWSK